MHQFLITGFLCLFVQGTGGQVQTENQSQIKPPVLMPQSVQFNAKSNANTDLRREDSETQNAVGNPAANTQAQSIRIRPLSNENSNQSVAGEQFSADEQGFSPSRQTFQQFQDSGNRRSIQSQSFEHQAANQTGQSQMTIQSQQSEQNPVQTTADRDALLRQRQIEAIQAANSNRAQPSVQTRQNYQVQPATFTQTTGTGSDTIQSNSGTSNLAKELIEDAMKPATENLLPGKRIRLEQAIAQRSDTKSRLALIKDYWKLTVALADYQFATEEVDFISRVAAPKAAEARALWQSEVAASEARVAEAKLAAIDAQETLRQKLSLGTEELPVPTDTPWVGRYRTNYEEHASAGVGSTNLKRIDRVLPVMWQLVQRRASAVQSSRVAFSELARVYQSGGLPVGELLDMHRRLRDQRIAFLAAVRDYNYSIADYAMSTVNAHGQAEQVVGMMLYNPAAGLSEIGGNIRQASADNNPAYQGANVAPSIQPSAETRQPSTQNGTGGFYQNSTGNSGDRARFNDSTRGGFSGSAGSGRSESSGIGGGTPTIRSGFGNPAAESNPQNATGSERSFDGGTFQLKR